jgi:hypothetical protein
MLIDTTNQIDLQAGGSFEITAGGNSSMRTLGDADTFITKTLKETIGLGAKRNVSAGGDKETVGLGDYTISVLGGSITLACSAPLTLASVSSISMVTPILNLSQCDSIQLPATLGVGFESGAGSVSVPIQVMPGIGLGTTMAPIILAEGII